MKRAYFIVEDGGFSQCRYSACKLTHAVLADHTDGKDKGKTTLRRWSKSAEAAETFATVLRSFTNKPWENIRVVPVVAREGKVWPGDAKRRPKGAAR